MAAHVTETTHGLPPGDAAGVMASPELWQLSCSLSAASSSVAYNKPPWKETQQTIDLLKCHPCSCTELLGITIQTSRVCKFMPFSNTASGRPN